MIDILGQKVCIGDVVAIGCRSKGEGLVIGVVQNTTDGAVTVYAFNRSMRRARRSGIAWQDIVPLKLKRVYRTPDSVLVLNKDSVRFLNDRAKNYE